MIYPISLLLIILIPGLASYISYILGKKSEHYRNVFNVTLTGILFIFVTLLYPVVSNKPIELFVPDIMGTGLFLKLDTFRYIFVWITVFIWFLTTTFTTRYLLKYKNRNRYYAFFMLTLGSTIGIFLSEHLLNLFTFFEIMSFTSYVLVIHDEDEYAHEAGRSYIGMAIAGGLVLLMGLFLLYDYTGTLNINELPEKVKLIGSVKYLISTLIIIGFGVKASMVPLHVWLPKAYPAAPAPASAILSAILAKTGVFGILIVVAVIMDGDLIISSAIMTLGLMNMFFGGLLAIFQRNVKRILAYSSMSQIGYMLLGIGLIGFLQEHKAIAIYGTIYHIVNHAFYKGLLFLVAGIIYIIVHDLSINEIRGFGKHKQWLKILFIIGMFGVMGIPGFNGFASKTLLHEALLEARHIYHSGWFAFAEIVFIVSSSFTIAYLLKMFFAVFMERNEKYWYQYQYKGHIHKRVIFPLIVLSGVIVFIGIWPTAFMHVLNNSLDVFGVHHGQVVKFYTWHNIQSSLWTMVIGTFIYFVFVRTYLRKKSKKESWYVNPSLHWFNIERDIYGPVIKNTYTVSNYILNAIDQSAMTIVNVISNMVKSFSNIEITYKKDHINTQIQSAVEQRQQRYSNRLENLHHSVNKESSVTNIFNKLRTNLNSVMYSIFIFATVLVIVLLRLLIK